MHPRSLSLATLCLLLAVPQAFAQEPTTNNLVIDASQTLEADAIDVRGDVVVSPGATLELRGVTMRVGGSIQVAEGATLLLGPSGGQPTRLLPRNEALGFSIHVHGHAASAGEPRTEIRGLNGDGLDSVVGYVPGGLTVSGTADLRDVDIRNGTAGVIASPGARVALTDAYVGYLYLMGIASYGGQIDMDRVTVRDNIIGVTGRGPGCGITVRDSDLDSWTANFQVTACDLLVQDSVLTGSHNNVFQGNAELAIKDTLITGYKLTGLKSDGGGTRVSLDGVLLDGEGEGESGLKLEGSNQAVLRNTTITGHTGDGLATGTSAVHLENVQMFGNEGYGIRAVNVRPPDGLETAYFGDPGVGTANVAGAVSDITRFPVTIQDEAGEAVVATVSVTVRDEATGETVFHGTGDGVRPVIASFETFGTDPAGRPVQLGPFTYDASSPGMGDMRGDVALYSEGLRLTATEPSEQTPWPNLALATVGALLLSYGIAAGRRRWRTSDPSREDPPTQSDEDSRRPGADDGPSVNGEGVSL